MTVAHTVGGDVLDVLHGDPIPARGLAIREGLLYEEGQVLGVPCPGPPSTPVAFDYVLEDGEYVRVFYRPIAEVLAEVPEPEPEPESESARVDFCSYPRHRDSDWIADDGSRCGVCHPPAAEDVVRRGDPGFDELAASAERRVTRV